MAIKQTNIKKTKKTKVGGFMLQNLLIRRNVYINEWNGRKNPNINPFVYISLNSNREKTVFNKCARQLNMYFQKNKFELLPHTLKKKITQNRS